jgi:hypothetical protein
LFAPTAGILENKLNQRGTERTLPCRRDQNVTILASALHSISKQSKKMGSGGKYLAYFYVLLSSEEIRVGISKNRLMELRASERSHNPSVFPFHF